MRICVVTQQLGRVFSGPGIHSRNLVADLLKHGHDVFVVSLEDQKYQPGSRDPSSNYVFIGVKKPVFLNNQSRWFSLSFAFNKAIRKLATTTELDLIHFTDARDGFFCTLKVPRIGNVNDTYSAELMPLGYYRRNYFDWFSRWAYYHVVHYFEKLFLQNFDAVIANSNFTAQTIKTIYPKISSKVVRIYKSIDRSSFRDVYNQRRKFPEQEHNKILLIGSNLQRKGIRYLIDAAASMKNLLPGVEYFIAGSDANIPKVQKFCEQKGVAHLFHFLGHQDRKRINSLFTEAAVLVLPALTEAFGIVLLEAMASGVPVIASNIGGMPEIIQDGVNGLLAEPENSHDLQEKILLVMNNQELRHSIIEKGFESVSNFSVENMMEQTYALYQQVVNKR